MWLDKKICKKDQYTIEKLGFPGIVLMGNSGASGVEEIFQYTADKNTRVIVLAGGGNNGGDGFVIARRLFDNGLSPNYGY